LRSVCPVQPDIWDGWVFGGKSLNPLADGSTPGVRQQTCGLIDLVRETMRTNPYIPVNRLPSRLIVSEMRNDQYLPHYGVNLNVATGVVTWVADPADSFSVKTVQKTRKMSH
jgi:hypothetical protein